MADRPTVGQVARRVGREALWAPIAVVVLHWAAGGLLGHEPYVDPVMHFLGGAAAAFFRSLASIRIAAGKYCSEDRKEILRMCRVLDRVEVWYEELFSVQLFPMAGTASGWT